MSPPDIRLMCYSGSVRIPATSLPVSSLIQPLTRINPLHHINP